MKTVRIIIRCSSFIIAIAISLYVLNTLPPFKEIVQLMCSAMIVLGAGIVLEGITR